VQVRDLFDRGVLDVAPDKDVRAFLWTCERGGGGEEGEVLCFPLSGLFYFILFYFILFYFIFYFSSSVLLSVQRFFNVFPY
jgi:peptidoglycan biosynthesis protein MviN/MurJ (putative lipid II flippase)